MAEWLKAHAWKACVRQRTEGSNPSLSALKRSSERGPLFIMLDGFELFCRKAVGLNETLLKLVEQSPNIILDRLTVISVFISTIEA